MIKKTLTVFFYTLLGGLLGILLLYVYIKQSGPDLSPWHVLQLENEYTQKKSDSIHRFQDYLTLENNLFAELDEKIYANTEIQERKMLLRYKSGSLADPATYKRNWNRSFELTQLNAKGGVLLLHGLSDSPYSLRAIAESLHAQGYYVLGLRMPGHGTIPSALIKASWQDMADIIRLAAKHVQKNIGSSSNFHIIGYSMGAAQAVNYSLDALLNDSMPQAKSLVLISPAIGVSSVAAFAIWQSRLSAIPGMEKLAWNAIGPEYDPFKYVSFAVNAGDLMYRLTLTLASKLADKKYEENLANFPATLAFLSAVDATTTVSAVADVLFSKLKNTGNELVIFDINRNRNIAPFLRDDPAEAISNLMNTPDLNYDVSLLTNISVNSNYIKEDRLSINGRHSRKELNLHWPNDVYSLSHVALPFQNTDSLYGNKPESANGLHIGLLAARGERAVLNVTPGEMLRLKYNPFYDYLETRTDQFISQ